MQEELFSNNCLQYSRVDGYDTFNCFAFKYDIHYGLLTILSQATTSGKKKKIQTSGEWLIESQLPIKMILRIYLNAVPFCFLMDSFELFIPYN